MGAMTGWQRLGLGLLAGLLLLGIDFAQRNRNLPFIGKVRFTDPE